MRLRALIFDFRVLAPFEINYVKAKQVLSKESAIAPSTSSRTSANISDQILTLVEEGKKRSSREKYEQLASAISGALEESELEQINHVALNMGVKGGLGALKSMKLEVIASTDIGNRAAEKFLREKEIDSCFSQVAARNELHQMIDLGARLEPVLEKIEIKPEEAIYFCNRLRDLKAAQALGLRTMVMPSKLESIDVLLRAKPEGMIISLEELPTMLSLKSFKGDGNEGKQPEIVFEKEGGEKMSLPPNDKS